MQQNGNGKPWEFTIRDVLNVVGAQATGKTTRKGETEIICPRGLKHSDGKPVCIGVNLERNNFKCFHECSDCPNRGGMLDLYNLFTGRPAEDRAGAKREIIEKLGTGSVKPVQISPVERTWKAKESDAAAPETLDRTYRAVLNELTLYAEHAENLKERGLNDTAIRAGFYRSIPTQKGEWTRVLVKLREEKITFTGVPGFYSKDGKVFATAYRSGFFIPYFDECGRICGMQIRYDKPVDKKHRYMWFSSAGYENGCSARNVCTFGIPGFQPKCDGKKTIYVTEGALKSYIASALDSRHHPFVAIAGVKCYAQWDAACAYLEQCGVKFVVDAFDSDRETNFRVMEAIGELYKIAKKHGIRMRRFNWGTEQKGIDDYLLSVVRKKEEKNNGATRKFVPPPKHVMCKEDQNVRKRFCVPAARK